MKDVTFGIIIIGMMVFCGVPLMVMFGEAITNTHVHQCTITGREPNGFTGGHFYDLSCADGVTLSNIASGQSCDCARIGDSVTAMTYGGWWVDHITGDSNC